MRRAAACSVPSADTPDVAQQRVYEVSASTRCLFSSSPGLPRGLFGTDFGPVLTRVARTFLRTFWQLAARGAPLSAHFGSPDSLRRVFVLIGKQTWIGLGNLGRDRADCPPFANILLDVGPVVIKVDPVAGSRNATDDVFDMRPGHHSCGVARLAFSHPGSRERSEAAVPGHASSAALFVECRSAASFDGHHE